MSKKQITLEDMQPATHKGASVRRFFRNFRRDWQLYALILLPVIYICIFYYWPMYGVQIAFRDYRPKAGILGSEWVGLKWFTKFIKSRQFTEVITNTVVLSLYNLFASFPLAIILALMLNNITRNKFRRVVQTVSYIPYFFSTTVLLAIVDMLLSPVTGVYGNFYHLFGGEGIPHDFRGDENVFRHLYVWSGVWQHLGWDAIIYTAALTGVPKELHEAAKVDGASRLRRILHVDLPCIMPTAGMMFILKCGSVLSVGFEKAYLLQSNLNLGTSEVISTYVYKVGMGSFRDFSFGAAIGLFNAVVNLAMVILANTVSKKISDNNVSIF